MGSKGKKIPTPASAIVAPAAIDTRSSIPAAININQTDRYLPAGQTQPYNLPNEAYVVNGQMVSQRKFDPVSGGYNSTVTTSPGDKQSLDMATNLLGNVYQGATQALDVTPEQKQKTIDSLYQPAARELENSYNASLGGAISNASRQGVENSLGFDNYRAKILDKQLGDAKASLMQNATMQAETLPSQKVAPFINVAAMLNSGADASTSRALQLLNPSFYGSSQSIEALSNQWIDKLKAAELASNFNNAYYTNLLNAANALNQYNLGNAQQQNQYNASVYGPYVSASMAPRNKKLGIF